MVGAVTVGTPSEPAATPPPTEVVVPTASPSDVEIQAKSPQPGDASPTPTDPEIAGAEKEPDDLQDKLTRKASEVFPSTSNQYSRKKETTTGIFCHDVYYRYIMQYNVCTIFMNLVVVPWQMRLRNAAKAKLNRWVKPKTRRLDRNAPEILRTEWAKGSRNAIADLLCKNNFQEDCFFGGVGGCCKLVWHYFDQILLTQDNSMTYNFTERQDTFLNELRVLVSKKQLVEVTKEEGWYSQEEMREDLKWSKFCPQPGEDLEVVLLSLFKFYCHKRLEHFSDSRTHIIDL